MASRKSSQDPQSKTEKAPVEESSRQRRPEASVRVFVSHDADHHRDWAYRIAADIEALGASAWLSSRDIPAGGNWQASIDKAFGNSTHLIVLVGRSPASNWVNEETGLGMQRMLKEGSEYKVIPVLVEANAPLTGRLGLLQAPDLVASYPDGLSALAEQLGLQAAMTSFQSGLLARWDGGYAVLRRHAEILSSQLSRMQRAIEDEQKLVDQKANAAELSTTEAKKLRLRAQELDVRARNAAERATGAAAEAHAAVAERERSQTILADLGRRMAELEASHQPVIAKIDQAAELLEQAHRSGALSVDREGDLVSLLEDPTQLVSLEPARQPTFASFQQELRLREALFSVVEEATEEAPEVRDIVLGSCLSAWAREVQPALPTLSVVDDSRIDELRQGLAGAIVPYLARRRHGYDVIEALDVAVATLFSHFFAHRGGPVAREGASIGIRSGEPAPPPEPRFDLTITNVRPELDPAARDSVAQVVHTASKRSAGESEVDGFFTALKVALGTRVPVLVLRGVIEETAIGVADDLKRVGVDVVIRAAAS